MSDSFETLSLHAGYTPENGGPRVLPICQHTFSCFPSFSIFVAYYLRVSYNKLTKFSHGTGFKRYIIWIHLQHSIPFW